MQSISQFTQSLKTLERSIFLLNTHLEPVILSDSIPEGFEALFEFYEIETMLEQATQTIEELSTIFSPLVTLFKTATMKRKTKDSMEPYASFIIDGPPLVQSRMKQLSFDDIMSELSDPPKPIQRRKPLEYQGVCINCGAPNGYIYKHTHDQLMCKICTHTFSLKPTYHDEIVHRCPHCVNKLILQHERKHFDTLLCPNDSCKFYLENKKSLKHGDVKHLTTLNHNIKLRYTFRLFNFNLKEIQDKLPLHIRSKIDLSNIHHSHHTLGLILTYYVNYGLSSRKVSRIMLEIHDIQISHQTVVNYAEAAASILECLNQHYPYQMENTLTFDETYIKVNGKNHYVFFGSDTTRKIVTSYRIFEHRNTQNAIISLHQTFAKFKNLPDDLSIIADGNPIYNAAQVFFHMYDISFNLYQVIGVKNSDPISLKYRHFKQAEERLNRTYKQNYYGTNGYGSLRNANVYISLYVSFFNFLRSHSSLKGRTPVEIEVLEDTRNMPMKWIKLIQYTNDFFKLGSYMN